MLYILYMLYIYIYHYIFLLFLFVISNKFYIFVIGKGNQYKGGVFCRGRQKNAVPKKKVA